jgi:prevent-host-death family protein
MPEIGAYEAKTHLGQLLERVEKGERFVITRHGRPVAELVPAEGRDRLTVRQQFAALHALRAGLAARGVSARALVSEGGSLRDLATGRGRGR